MSDIDMKYILKAYDKANEQKIKSPYAKYFSLNSLILHTDIFQESSIAWPATLWSRAMLCGLIISKQLLTFKYILFLSRLKSF